VGFLKEPRPALPQCQSPCQHEQATVRYEQGSDMRSAEMYRVDITADLNDEDHTGYVWTFLEQARDPGQIQPGAIVVAGDEDTAVVCQVVDLVRAGDGTIVHLKLLPGLVEDYQASSRGPWRGEDINWH
jgi:hypothetical protein